MMSIGGDYESKSPLNMQFPKDLLFPGLAGGLGGAMGGGMGGGMGDPKQQIIMAMLSQQLGKMGGGGGQAQDRQGSPMDLFGMPAR